MNEPQFAQMLEELMWKIGDGPGSHPDVLEQIAQKHAAVKELNEAVERIKESFGALRLIVKYLVFDLEATRRERDELRMLLEDQD